MLISIASLLGFCIMSFWFVQIARGPQYRTAAENNQYQVNRIAAPRGKLLDRTGGTILVDNRPSFNICIIPEKCENFPEQLSQLSDMLQLSAIEREAVERRRARRVAFQPLLVREDVAFEEMTYFAARQNDFPWVKIAVDQKRVYPHGLMAAHIFGNVGEVSEAQLRLARFAALQPGTMVGKSGLEFQYQESLSGTDGAFVEVRDSLGRQVKEVSRTAPITGQDMVLTIDFELQKKAEELFADKAGALIAIDVRNGEVLALVSSPAFDPNSYVEHFAELRSDPASPLLNRAISSMFSPGSVWKAMIASAGLREGLITPDRQEFCGGGVFLANRQWSCNGAHGWVDLRSALTHSCNVYFYKLGNRLGIEKIHKWATRFGFGSVTGIDLPNEKDGLVPTQDWMERAFKRPWYPADTISVSIGQGSLLVTPVQLAVYMAAIANGGTLVKPHLVRGMRRADGGIVLFSPPAGEPTGIEDDILRDVRQGLWGVVHAGGTAPRANIPEISIAGKTGTAQVVAKRYWREDMPEELRHHVWFVCFAPTENPEVALTVFVEHGENSSRVAVPIATEFLRAYASRKQLADKPADTRRAE